ncbi:MAG: prolyl oligopeptidase family serine peptidase [Planctomycetaceae bacterium]|nr:prolyl oligopeptidase family serine peptidase [Planctomycetaceae bacterium]
MAKTLLFTFLFCCAASVGAGAAEPLEIVPRSGLLLQGLPGRLGEQLPVDPVEAALIERGDQPLALTAGSTMELGGTSVSWEPVEFNARGGFEDPVDRRKSAYVYIPIESDRDQVMLLSAGGYSFAYLNGVPRGGNLYGYGYVHLPVQLHQGTNELVLHLSWRSPLRVKLEEPAAPVMLSKEDATLPDLVVGESLDAWGAVVVTNASEHPVSGLVLACSGEGLEGTTVPLPTLPPLSLRKVAFPVRASAPATDTPVNAALRLTSTADPSLDLVQDLPLRVRLPHQQIQRTFLSEIDGSVQYYGLRLASPLSPDDPAPAIVLSCHGASVEGIRQAGSYPTKSWLHLVAPTNRRPYGFDWEDFGRADALEVLAIAQRTLAHDRSRVYLTGHSMGGHGTWHIGATFPDRFAALGPSAGWVSYSLYRRDRANETSTSPLDEILRRGNLASDTIALAPNLKHHGIYIVHGADDDNVPPGQARLMAETLEPFHHDWYYHEEPKQNHWWSNDFADGGASCMDWPEMFDMFARHALPPTQAVRRVDFITANPGVSSECHWAAIEAQQRQHALSRINLMTWPNARRFEGTTDNVARLRLETAHLRTDGPISVVLDGQALDDIPMPTDRSPLWIARTADVWSVVEQPTTSVKGPHRYGSVKSELRNRFLIVYGTQGTDEENRWTYNKARYDAESFWYRGNASVDFVADQDFTPDEFADRTVLLYGNADTNSAWESLLKDSPVQLSRGAVRIGDRAIAGEDLAAVFLRPRMDSDRACVVVIGGTGPAGMRACHPLSLFQPFTRYPDLTVVRGPEPSATGNVRGLQPLVAGYFGLDWSLSNGEIVWSDIQHVSWNNDRPAVND